VNRPPSPLNMLLSRHTRRREFITLLGSTAAAWPIGARAQQAAVPVVGYLGIASPEDVPDRFAGFRSGLGESGFREGENVTVEYRATKGQFDRFSEYAAELARSGANIIFAADNVGALAAKAATTASRRQVR